MREDDWPQGSVKTGLDVLSIPRNKWADFEEPEKSFDKILEEAYGKQEASEIIAGLGRVIESEETEIIKFRADLSYIPGK